MNQVLRTKLAELPKAPGVYFHKNTAGQIIYVGKAAVLRNRVRQYFQQSRDRDPKTEALVAEIADTDWIVTESEIDALFLEAEMIRRYLPPYNILLRDDKSLQYVRIDIASDYPTVTLTHRPLDDGAEYFGPYVSGWTIKRALKYLRRAFPYATHRASAVSARRSRLNQQIGIEPKLQSAEDLELYRANLRKLVQYIRGSKKPLITTLQKEMKQLAKAGQYEQAARVRDQLYAVQALAKEIIFSDKEFLDISKDKGLAGLAELLGLYDVGGISMSHEPGVKSQEGSERDTRSKSHEVRVMSQDKAGKQVEVAQRMFKMLRRIEGYDISHMSGTDTVASMVVFGNGVPDKASYRKFKMRIPGNDDFAHMHEAISRRLSPKNVKQWKLPDLFLIDGGKGQLGAALRARDEAGYHHIPMVGLAKKQEQIVIKKPLAMQTNSDVALNEKLLLKQGGYVYENDDFLLVELPHSTDIVKLLQRIRDESHRFAVSYHSTLKRTRQTDSWLDTIPTIGPETKKKLLRSFGSVRGVMQARDWELEKVVGEKKAAILHQYIRAANKGKL